tara:strand:- start:68 stop:289 length:222 start_codon:yes stop_codon:yes gene_type:complete
MAYRLSSNRQPGIKKANTRKTKKPKVRKKNPQGIRTRKDSIMYSGQSKGYPDTLDVRYAKDAKLQERRKKRGN